MTSEFTVKEYAAKERVTDRTVRNWIEKGAVKVRRTPGGRIRIVVLSPDREMKDAEMRGSTSR